MNPKTKIQNAISPRPYLSWSQIQLYERSPELYVRKYIFTDEDAPTEAMRLGKKLAQALELQTITGDDALDNLRSLFPTYPQREFKIEATLEGMEVPLFGIMDGFDEKQLRIGEYKSGLLWDQKMVDESGQLKMYALMVYLKYERLPGEVALHWARTRYNEAGLLELTGEIKSFRTEVTDRDLFIFSTRVLEAWSGIQALFKEHHRESPPDHT
jgi:hypothetical protein